MSGRPQRRSEYSLRGRSIFFGGTWHTGRDTFPFAGRQTNDFYFRDDIVVTPNASVAPQPSTLSLFGLGLLGGALLGRKKKLLNFRGPPSQLMGCAAERLSTRLASRRVGLNLGLGNLLGLLAATKIAKVRSNASHI